MAVTQYCEVCCSGFATICELVEHDRIAHSGPPYSLDKSDSSYRIFLLTADTFYRETGLTAPGMISRPESREATNDERIQLWVEFVRRPKALATYWDVYAMYGQAPAWGPDTFGVLTFRWLYQYLHIAQGFLDGHAACFAKYGEDWKDYRLPDYVEVRDAVRDIADVPFNWACMIAMYLTQDPLREIQDQFPLLMP